MNAIYFGGIMVNNPWTILFLYFSFCIFGCASEGSPSKLTAQNFLKVQTGMNHQEVTLILGQPTEKMGEYPNPRIWKWRDGSNEITVVINSDGNVAAKTQKGLE